MTERELEQVLFHWVGHMSFADEHLTTYSSEDGKIGFCVHVKMDKFGEPGRAYRHYRIGDKIYKSKAKFLDALKSI